jgi:hypothetical protein
MHLCLYDRELGTNWIIHCTEQILGRASLCGTSRQFRIELQGWVSSVLTLQGTCRILTFLCYSHCNCCVLTLQGHLQETSQYPNKTPLAECRKLIFLYCPLPPWGRKFVGSYIFLLISWSRQLPQLLGGHGARKRITVIESPQSE